jgi:hypothetical protein
MSINQVAEKMETQVPEAKAQAYQAIGYVTGVLDISDFKKPTLLIKEHTYPVSFDPRAFWKHKPGEIKSFLTYPKTIDEKLGFALLWVKNQPPKTNTFTLKGCWEEEDNQSHLKIYRNQTSFNGNFISLALIWDNCPSADGQYWEIEAELCEDSFHVISAIGPFDPPQKFYGQEVEEKPTVIKSDLPRPILKGDKEPIPLIAGHGAIEENPITAKSAEVIKPIASSEIKAIAESPRESIEPEEPEASPVVVEPVTPKTKKASGKSSAPKKLSISPETVEPKKAKEKVKVSSSKKPMSLAADRLFLGKQLPPGK